jgi:Hypothetical glycosyl hydrolase family 15
MTRHGDYRTATLADSVATMQARREAREDALTPPWYNQDHDVSVLPGDHWDDQEHWTPPAPPVPTAPPVRRPRLSRKQIVVCIAANLTLIVAVLVAIGPAHLFVQAASNYTIYNDTLARGWHNWSYHSTVNVENTTPVYTGSRSIAWTSNTGWATLYLRAGTSINLSNYSALTFAMQASQANEHVGVALTDGHNHAIARLAPLSNYGGAPPVGSWKVYTIPRSVLAPHASKAYGVMLQNWSSYSAPTIYVDSIRLLRGSTTPVSTATATTDPTSTAIATTERTATATQTGQGGIYSNLPLTTNNIHVELSFNYNVQNVQGEAGTVDVVWASSYATQPPGVYNTYYYPFEREAYDWQVPSGHNLSWFQTYHPDWIEYKCDKSTVAYEFGNPNVPLDIANTAVLSYMWSTYLRPALAAGYKGLAFDNVGFWNRGRCGHYDLSGNWVQQYSGSAYDTAYENTVLSWAKYMYTQVHTQFPGDTVGMNVQYDSNVPSLSYQMYQYVDLDCDERGFTNWGNSSTDNFMTGSTWLANMHAIQYEQSLGHGYFSLNQEPEGFSSLTTQDKEWVLSNYLLIKGRYTYVVMTGQQQYGSLDLLPEYKAQIGSPTDDMYLSQYVYMRDYTNGMAIVNPSASNTYTVTLSGTHHDLYGNPISGAITLAPHSGAVLLNYRYFVKGAGRDTGAARW